jgi:hypothetical protein
MPSVCPGGSGGRELCSGGSGSLKNTQAHLWLGPTWLRVRVSFARRDTSPSCAQHLYDPPGVGTSARVGEEDSRRHGDQQRHRGDDAGNDNT